MIPLIGPIDPQRWFLPKTLEELWLGEYTDVDNRINSPLPHACTLPKSLAFLDLGFSTFTGTIPPSWLSPTAGGLGMPESLIFMSLSYNRLGGCMPANWGFDTCGCFSQLFMEGNNFKGEDELLPQGPECKACWRRGMLCRTWWTHCIA